MIVRLVSFLLKTPEGGIGPNTLIYHLATVAEPGRLAPGSEDTWGPMRLIPCLRRTVDGGGVRRHGGDDARGDASGGRKA